MDFYGLYRLELCFCYLLVRIDPRKQFMYQYLKSIIMYQKMIMCFCWGGCVGCVHNCVCVFDSLYRVEFGMLDFNNKNYFMNLICRSI